MNEHPHDYLSNCFGKQSFRNQNEANKVLNRVPRRRRNSSSSTHARLCTYKCNSCGYIHIGTRSTKH